MARTAPTVRSWGAGTLSLTRILCADDPEALLLQEGFPPRVAAGGFEELSSSPLVPGGKGVSPPTPAPGLAQPEPRAPSSSQAVPPELAARVGTCPSPLWNSHYAAPLCDTLHVGNGYSKRALSRRCMVCDRSGGYSGRAHRHSRSAGITASVTAS